MEKKEPFVSVVVPIYNVERYLRRCIDSLLNQNYDNYEIILVDDGSPDRCGEICEEYVATNSKIKCFHKTNGGLSDARNYGVKKANGDYIAFVDSDDYVTDDYISYLIELLFEYKSDMVVAGLTFVSEKEEKKESGKKVFERNVLSTEEALERMCYVNGFGVSACSKLYPKQLLLKYPYPVGKMHEDLATTYKIIGECKSIAYGGKDIYFYWQRSDSIMHEKIDKTHLYGFVAAKEQLDYIEKNFPNVSRAAHCRYARKVFEFMPRIVYAENNKENKKIYKRLQIELKPHYYYAVTDKNVWLAAKVRYTGIMLGYYPAIFIWKVIDKIKNCKK